MIVVCPPPSFPTATAPAADILHGYKIHNAEVLVREDAARPSIHPLPPTPPPPGPPVLVPPIPVPKNVVSLRGTVDDFIDVVEGNRQYLPSICVYNKVPVGGGEALPYGPYFSAVLLR